MSQENVFVLITVISNRFQFRISKFEKYNIAELYFLKNLSRKQNPKKDPFFIFTVLFCTMSN